MARSYLPILLLFVFVIIVAATMIGLSAITMTRQPTAVKLQPYESGMSPLGDARDRFSVKFYLVAMLFIVFDIETVFMIPWGVYFRELSCRVPLVAGATRDAAGAAIAACPAGQLSFFGLGEMLVFVGILVIGLVYVWKKGALQWD